MSKRFVNMIILGAILAGLLTLGIGYAEETTPAPAAASTAPALKPDPSGANTGGAADVVGATPGAPTAEDMKKWATNEPLAMKLADVVGHYRIAINIVWTLICGYLVFFMQAGFAMLETGFTRAKNAAHTMAMNLMVFVFGVLGYWIIGYALQMGGVGANPLAGGTGLLDAEFTLHLTLSVPSGLHGYGGNHSNRCHG
jgi:Amt family ammonium transporter